MGKDAAGLGHVTITLIVFNECNEEGSSVSRTFPAQGVPPCVPADVDLVVVDPPDNPLTLGTSYTFSPFGLSGTPPYTFKWFLNGTLVATTQDFVHTLVDADVVDKDVTGLGRIVIYVVVYNACNTDGASTNPDASYPAQGTPP